MNRCALPVACALFVALAPTASAQTENSYPMLMSVKPAAAQVGATSEHEVNARYSLSGADQVIVAGDGVKGEIVPEEKSDKNAKEEPARGRRRGRGQQNASKIKVRFTVAADAVPGVRDFRIVTPHGASTVGQIVVARDPIVGEVAGINTFDKAQAISLPATVCGAIEKVEDVDFFKFKVEAGTALTFHVRSQRLLNRLHDMQTRIDPMITLKSAAGVTLAASDNYYAGDPLLYHKFDLVGEYVLEVRDVRYQGNVDWMYSIEINNRPFVTQAMPLAVKAGVEARLSLVGYNLPADPGLSLTLPADTPAGMHWVSPAVGGQPANEFALFVTGLPTVLESPPSAAPSAGAPPAGSAEAVAVAANPTATAQRISVPTVVTGRIGNPGESDLYAFEAKSGDKLTFEVLARRAQSGLDPFLRILNDKGAAISEADDMTFDRVISADSCLENWSAPAEGKYLVEIRDLHLRGGPQYTYAVQVTKSEPHFLIQTDSDKTLLAPGIASVIFVRALRKNGFAGDIQLGVEGLPAGVTAVAGKVLANANDGCVILQAAADAPDSAANIRILGTATHPVPNGQPLALTAVAQHMQEYYSPGGGRGSYPVDLHTVSVADPMDVRSVKLSMTNVVLKPGASAKIEVEIERALGFKGNVTLDVLFQHLEQPHGNSLPKGVKMDGGASKTLLTGEETKGFITLKAADDAPAVEKQLIPVMAHISINFVMKHTLCGAPVFVTVEPK